MYARLWWKDLRQFWPIWVLLLLASLAAQTLVLHYAGPDARDGALPPLALSFAWLYAVAVGAAAFAGERENGTLRLLDTLPVDRFLLWRGKASFGLVSMLALAVVVLIPAAGLTDRWEPSREGNSIRIAVGYFVLLVEALGWGLLTSALSRTALTAALGAACCGAASLAVILLDLDTTHQTTLLVRSIPIRLLVIAATAVFSALAMTRVHDRGSSRTLSIGARSAGQAWAVVRSPIVFRSPLVRDTASAPSRLWARWPEVRSVAWLTCHQGWRLAGLLVVVGVGLPVLLSLVLVRSGIDAGFFVLGVWAVLFVVGINVFGAENRGRTHRFLAHHGARPGLVWGTKLMTWTVAFLLIGLVVTPVVLALLVQHRPPTDSAEFLAWLAMWIYPFFMALFCGMVMRRGITAWVVSLILMAALISPQAMLMAANLMSPLAIMVPPFAFLFLTWAWRRDWMLDRPAPGRWLRLGAWTAGTAAVLFGWYVGGRAWGISYTPPIAAPATWKTPAVADEHNAAKIYDDIHKQAYQWINDADYSDKSKSGELAFKRTKEFLKHNPDAYKRLITASSMPICRFMTNSTHQTAFSLLTYVSGILGRMMTDHANDLLGKGDLAGAWGDIESLFRMGRQYGQDALNWQALAGLNLEEEALSLAMEWAADSRQTPERLRAALNAYRELPPMVSALEILRGEARLVEQTFALPRGEIRQGLMERRDGRKGTPSTLEALGIAVSTTPWEIERARRINRVRFAEEIERAALAPSMRDRYAQDMLALRNDPNRQEARQLSQLVPNAWNFVARNDWNEVGRRALEQILALRIWQLEHGGKLPESLDALVPDLLPRLPADPFSGQGFRYVPSVGWNLPLLGDAIRHQATSKSYTPTDGCRLLYSVGPDRVDDRGTVEKSPGTYNPAMIKGDVVFPLKDNTRKD